MGKQNRQVEVVPTEETMVELYGHELATFGTQTRPLVDQLFLEKKFCQVPDEKRQDQEPRVRAIAKALGANTLLPEHQHLLDETL